MILCRQHNYQYIIRYTLPSFSYYHYVIYNILSLNTILLHIDQALCFYSLYIPSARMHRNMTFDEYIKKLLISPQVIRPLFFSISISSFCSINYLFSNKQTLGPQIQFRHKKCLPAQIPVLHRTLPFPHIHSRRHSQKQQGPQQGRNFTTKNCGTSYNL